jgi:SSS family solute:Na+ symporter
LGTGVVYLWVLPSARYHFWPHYLLLSFYIFVFLAALAVAISLLDTSPEIYKPNASEIGRIAKPTKRVKLAWTLLTIVMIVLYLIFNGH